jgi:hypothetical protein
MHLYLHVGLHVAGGAGPLAGKPGREFLRNALVIKAFEGGVGDGPVHGRPDLEGVRMAECRHHHHVGARLGELRKVGQPGLFGRIVNPADGPQGAGKHRRFAVGGGYGKGSFGFGGHHGHLRGIRVKADLVEADGFRQLLGAAGKRQQAQGQQA